MVREAAPRIFPHAGQRRSTFSRALSDQRRAAKHAGIPAGLELQGRPAHGLGKRLPGLVNLAGRLAEKPPVLSASQPSRKLCHPERGRSSARDKCFSGARFASASPEGAAVNSPPLQWRVGCKTTPQRERPRVRERQKERTSTTGEATVI